MMPQNPSRLFTLIAALCLALSPIASAIDLKVSTPKSAIRPGESTELHVIAANPTGALQTGIEVNFRMPSGFTGSQSLATPALSRGSAGLTTDEEVGWNIAQLAPGQIAHLRIMVTASSSPALPDGTAVPFEFASTVGGNADATAAQSITVDSQHVLDGAFSLETGGAATGEPFAAVLTYGNRGTEPESGVGVTLNLPAGVAFVDSSDAPSAQGGAAVSWNVGTLNPGRTGQIAVRLQFDAAAPAGSVRVIEMVAQSAGFSQSAALPLTPGTAGALHLAAGHDSIPVHKADGSAQLRLAATNSSSFTRNGVQLRFLMPDRIAGAQSWSDEPLAEGAAALTAGEVVGWDLPALATHRTAQVRFHLYPSSAQPAGSVIPVTFIAADDSGTQAVASLAIPIENDPALDVEIASRDLGARAGGDFALTVTVGNRSAAALAGVAPTLQLPPGLAGDLQIVGGGGSLSGDLVVFDPFNLPPGAVEERVLIGRFAPGATEANAAALGLCRRLGARATDASGSTPASAATFMAIQDQPGVDVSIAADQTQVGEGEPIRAQITVVNRGSFELTDLRLDLLVPEGFSGDQSIALPPLNRGAAGLTATELVGWDIASLAPGEADLFEIPLYPTATGTPGTAIALAARVRDAGGAALDDAQITTGVTASPPPELLIEADGLPAGPGETIRFTASYGNRTGSAIAGADLAIRLPRGIAFLFGEDGISHAPDPSFPGEGGGTISVFSGATLPPHFSGEAVFYAQVAADAEAGGILPVRGSLTAPGRGAASLIDVPVSSRSNLAVSIARVGAPVTDSHYTDFVAAVTNRAAFDLSDVRALFNFPRHSVGDQSFTSPPVDFGAAAITEGERTGWAIASLPAGETRFLRFRLREQTTLAADGQIESLSIHASAGDSSQSVAHGKVEFDATAPLDLALVSGPQAVAPGGTVALQLMLGNRSGSLVGTTEIRVDLPGDLLELVAPGANPPLVGNALRWTRANLSPGQGAVIPIEVRWRADAPLGSQATIYARADSSGGSAAASLTLAAVTPTQAQAVPAITASATTVTSGTLIDLMLQPTNGSAFTRDVVIADFFMPEGFSGNTADAEPTPTFGAAGLTLSERIGWRFDTYAAGQSTPLTQPLTFSAPAAAPVGSVIPIITGLYDDSRGHNLASLAILHNLAPASFAPVDPVGTDPTDLDADGVPDLYETGTGVYVSPRDTGTRPDSPDSDGDGIADGREIQVGFLNPNRDDAEAVAFFAQRTSDLAFGAPVIIRDPATGNFGLTIGIGESPNLGDPFTKRPITPAETSIIDGEIRLTIPAPGEAFFYRFYSSPWNAGN